VIFLATRGLAVHPGIKCGIMMVYRGRPPSRFNEFLVLGISDFIPVDIKGFYLHPVLGHLIHPDLKAYFPFLACASHWKLSARDIDHSLWHLHLEVLFPLCCPLTDGHPDDDHQAYKP
jgi:hypothetical protein